MKCPPKKLLHDDYGNYGKIYKSICYLFKVGYAMTTFQRETDQPVIGFDMGGS